jgi:hypothetical protein
MKSSVTLYEIMRLESVALLYYALIGDCVHPYVLAHFNAKLHNWRSFGDLLFQEKSRNLQRIAGLLICAA